MTQAMVTRQVRAAGIVERHEVEPIDDRPGWYAVRDSATGSGQWYICSPTQCCCADYVYRGQVCKHQRAAQSEAQLLTAYSIAWDSMVDLAREQVEPPARAVAPLWSAYKSIVAVVAISTLCGVSKRPSITASGRR